MLNFNQQLDSNLGLTNGKRKHDFSSMESIEIFRLLFETNNKIFDYDRNEIICEEAPLDMFKIFLAA